MFAKLPGRIDSGRVIELLKREKFYINGPFSIVPIKGFIRITVGPVEQMRRFISVFKQVYRTALSGS
jgi:histidinol-phosphate/aromatic aminotransferase/cobyric acid decarboxylase-like protein